MDVLLLRAMREQRIISAERFADMLQLALAQNDQLRISSATIQGSSLGGHGGLRRLDGFFARMVRYPIAVRRARADVYHILGHSYAHLARVLPTSRTIVTCNDLIPLRAAQGVAGFRVSWRATQQFRWITSHLKTVARVACISQSTRDDVRRLCGVPEERLTVIPLGVDASFRVLPSEQAASVRDKVDRRHVVLHVSSGGPYKNVQGTLNVVAALRRRGCDASLVRAGQPLTQAERELAHSLDIADAVIDRGLVSDDQLVELYNAADVLLFPSFYEGFGLPVLEAMACGLPVVTSDCPALLDVGGDAALNAPPSDVDALATAVMSILQERSLAADLRQRGIERAKLFSWRRTADAYASLYLQVFRETTR